MKRSFLLIAMLAVALAVAGCSSSGKTGSADAQKADANLAGAIQARLNADPLLSASQRSSVGVRVQNGVATLSGWVVNDAELNAALNAAQGVEGVRQVVSRLQVGQEFAAMPAAAPAFAEAPEQAEPRYSQPRAAVPQNRKPSASRPASKPVYRPAVQTTPSVNQDATYGTAANSAPTNVAPAPTQQVLYNPHAVALAPEPKLPERVEIPAGTEVPIRLIDSLSSESSNRDQLWRGTVNGDIIVDDRVVIPSGSSVEGRIVDVKKSTHYTGAAQLTLALNRVTFGGRSYAVASDQWTRKGAARGGNTAKKVGAGAAVGAALGGIFGGGKGAAIGAAAGAGAGAGANTITKGQKVELDSESLIIFRLASGVSVTPSAERERGWSSAPNRYVPPARDYGSDSDSVSDRPVLKRRG